MADNKKSFLLYCDQREQFDQLTDEQAGKLVKHLFAYVNCITPEVPDNLKNLYDRMIAQIEFEWSKYNPKTDKYHWNYQGGITPENHSIRNSQEYSNWRISVFRRDKYTCQDCSNIGGDLNAHHLKQFATHKDSRLDIDNGLTLCRDCHIKRHKK